MFFHVIGGHFFIFSNQTGFLRDTAPLIGPRCLMSIECNEILTNVVDPDIVKKAKEQVACE